MEAKLYKPSLTHCDLYPRPIQIKDRGGSVASQVHRGR